MVSNKHVRGYGMVLNKYLTRPQNDPGRRFESDVDLRKQLTDEEEAQRLRYEICQRASG